MQIGSSSMTKVCGWGDWLIVTSPYMGSTVLTVQCVDMHAFHMLGHTGITSIK